MAGSEKKKELSQMSRMDAIYHYGTPATITQMKNILRVQYSNDNAREWATWLIGESGIGKNHLQEQLAEELGIEYLWFPCKGIQPEDLRGFPALVRKLNGNEYKEGMEGIKDLLHDYYSKEPNYEFVQLKYLQKAFDPNWKGIIHFDEFPQASKEVQEMLYMFFYDRRLDDQYLSRGAMIIASMNPPQVNDYMLSKISKAAQDRPAIYVLSPSSKEWIEWAKKNNVHPTLVDFVADHPQVYDNNKGRRLKHFSDLLYLYPLDDPEKIPVELKIVAYATIRIDDADVFAKYLKDVFEISGIALLMGDKKSFKKLDKMIKGGEKAVHLYRINQEMIRGISDPAAYMKDIMNKNNGDLDKVWDIVSENFISYLKLLKYDDMDSAVGVLKEITRMNIMDLEDRVNTLLRKKENSSLFKEVLRCLSVNTNNKIPDDPMEEVKTESDLKSQAAGA